MTDERYLKSFLGKRAEAIGRAQDILRQRGFLIERDCVFGHQTLSAVLALRHYWISTGDIGAEQDLLAIAWLLENVQQSV